jgi:hypothetical protein
MQLMQHDPILFEVSYDDTTPRRGFRSREGIGRHLRKLHIADHQKGAEPSRILLNRIMERSYERFFLQWYPWYISTGCREEYK